MPTAITAGDHLMVTAYCMCNGQLAMNRYFYLISGSSGTTTIEDMAAQIETMFATQYADCMHEDATFWGIGVIKHPLTDPPYPLPVYSSTLRGDGTWTGDLLPKQTSGLISRRVSSWLARGKGKVYIPFPSETANSGDGTPNPNYQASLASLADSVFTASTQLTDAGSNTITVQAEMIGLDTDDVTWRAAVLSQYIPRNRWATQRRRGDFGKGNAAPF